MTSEKTKKPQYASLGECLVALRKKAGMTTAEVAQAANINESVYVGIEAGIHLARLSLLWRLASALGVSVQDMMV
jgi:transcriptional regulator with XRE-family HTH domain